MIDIFYLNDRLNHGECRLDWISIDTVRQLLEEYLCKPRSYSKSLFCSRDQRLRIGRRWFFSTSRSKAGFSAVLFKVCPKSIIRCDD